MRPREDGFFPIRTIAVFLTFPNAGQKCCTHPIYLNSRLFTPISIISLRYPRIQSNDSPPHPTIVPSSLHHIDFSLFSNIGGILPLRGFGPHTQYHSDTLTFRRLRLHPWNISSRTLLAVNYSQPNSAFCPIIQSFGTSPKLLYSQLIFSVFLRFLLQFQSLIPP